MNKQFALMTTAAFAVVASAPVAFAHGPQMQISRNTTNGKIETHQIIDTAGAFSSYTPSTRVFVAPVVSTFGEYFMQPDTSRNVVTGLPNYYSGPGLAYQFDNVLAGSGWAHSGSSTVPNLSGTSFSLKYTAGLKVWTGSAFVDAGATQAQSFLGANTAPTATMNTTDTAPFGALAIAVSTTQSANPHSTVRHRILGDGSSPTSASPNGIYLLSLQLESNAAGVSASDPFYFVLHQGTSQASALTAANSLGFSAAQTQAIPEPASAGLLALGAVGLLARRKRSAGAAD